MNIPPYLRSGDKVAVIAASRKVSQGDLAFALQTLQTWGLQPVQGKHLYAAHYQWAGTDQQRAEDLQWAVNDDSVKAIFFARGGNGIVRLIDRVDMSRLKTHPKWLVGYSDVTILHAHVQNCCNLASLHAPMLTVYEKNAESTESIRKCLFGEKIKYEFTAAQLSKPGTAKGQLVGGNISLLHTLSGTREDIDTNGKILFIEDLDENLHHLDRMMIHLKRAGKLQNLAALLVGGLNDMKDDPIPFGLSPEEIVLDAVKDYNYPVAFGFPAGHIERNLALCLGREATLQVGGAHSTLEF